jgi:hypothetical protein
MAKQISEIINQGIPASQTQQWTGGDQKFVESIRSKKIADCEPQELIIPLKWIMTKIGIRDQNLPSERQTVVLIDHIKQNFGGNHIQEIVLAFEMAIRGELDIDEKEVNAYENFSCLYFSRVMNSYRRWAIQEYRQYEKTIVPESKQIEYKQDVIHWGALIEQEYQHFLSFGSEKSKLWPAEFYQQLEQDGFIQKDFFRNVMPGVRQQMIRELSKEKSKIQNGTISGLIRGRAETAESIRRTSIAGIERKITDYENGTHDKEIELSAKQYCVVKVFQSAKEKFKEHLYIKE